MNNITIGSYNMSWASGMGLELGSEKNFVHNGLLYYPQQPKNTLWFNALDLLDNFWNNTLLKPAAIGLQEMNNNFLITDTNIGGIVQVINKLSNTKHTNKLPNAFLGNTYRKNKNQEYGFSYCSSKSNTTFPTLLTIWRTNIMGKAKHVYCNNILQNSGRPLLITFTQYGFTLINLHAPHMRLLRKNIQSNIDKAIRSFPNKITFFRTYTPNKIFIMGDFNDPHHTINDNNPLTIKWNTQYVTLKDGNIQGIKSCCYNFNSACPKKLYNHTNKTITIYNKFKDINNFWDFKALPYSCFITPYQQNDIPTSLSDYGDTNRGNIDNYRFTGDYCLGKYVIKPLSTYRPLNFKHKPHISLESDHELVYATFKY
jgi:hypothetical protein